MSSLVLPLTAGASAWCRCGGGRSPPRCKTLVAYFSRSGNTRVIAGQIHRARRADLFVIKPAKAYPEDYFETVEQARQERDNGYEPPLKTQVAGMANISTLFLGFPIWGETVPPAIRSFLSAYDLSGRSWSRSSHTAATVSEAACRSDAGPRHWAAAKLKRSPSPCSRTYLRQRFAPAGAARHVRLFYRERLLLVCSVPAGTLGDNEPLALLFGEPVSNRRHGEQNRPTT